MHACMHACMHTYIHTYIHYIIHTDIWWKLYDVLTCIQSLLYQAYLARFRRPVSRRSPFDSCGKFSWLYFGGGFNDRWFPPGRWFRFKRFCLGFSMQQKKVNCRWPYLTINDGASTARHRNVNWNTWTQKVLYRRNDCHMDWTFATLGNLKPY